MTALVRAVAALGLVFAAWLLGGSRSREEVVRAPIVRLAVKHPWLTAGTMAAGAAVIGALVVVSGVMPIGASSGHWAITAAFLDFAKVRSVSTHAWGISAPPLEDEALVLKGAGHYETACLPCHGAPGSPIPPVVAAMTPPPPELIGRISRWSPEELFWIVKHGIKFTGMPGWPDQRRDDEAWAMVAFLRRMPALDAGAYRQLASGNGSGIAEAPAVVRDTCRRCHGDDGTGRGPGAFPSLAGQHAEYLHASLRAFRDGRRRSGIMGEVAAGLDDAEMRQVAAYYERLPPRTPGTTRDASSLSRGQVLATQGDARRGIPACVECHGPAALPKNPAYPTLAGQHERYLRLQLTLLQQRRRGGTPNVDLMHVFVNRLGAGDIRDVTRYYAALAGVSP